MKLKDDNLYYVGGVVRDAYIKEKSLDIDYCYEGDAISFAKNSGLEIVRENPEFGTVRVVVGGEEIDIASTRTETYPKKGRLPRVKSIGCPLTEDLKRRDFTINAIAQRSTDGEIIDLFNGRKDIENKLLRVLHKDSFIDDPSRIVRGLKFSVRFNFELEEQTRKWQDEYLENINYNISYHRLRKELIETFSLNRQKCYTRFVNQGIYKLLGENQKVPQINISIEELVSKYPCKYVWLVYLGLFDLSNLALTKQEKRILEWAERLKSEKPTNNTPFESLLIHRLRVS